MWASAQDDISGAIPFPQSDCACGDDLGGYSSMHIIPSIHSNSSTSAGPGNGLLGMLPPRQPRTRTSHIKTPRRHAPSTRPKQPGDLCLAILLEHAISSRLHERAGVSEDSPATTSELDAQDALLAVHIHASLARLSTSYPAPPVERGAGSQIAHFAHGVPAWFPRASPLRQCGSATRFTHKFVTV
ncbi:hypothetical protein B0H14DRAFT_2560446 [Mycena olivaceomarginata]|nr:hypothetical protein B0H14DRAFT_2560446 [Mycena olivaceomarginata]